MPREREVKHQEDAQGLACRGLKFLPPDGASYLLGRDANIYEASCLLLTLLSSHVPPYDKVMDWIQLSYTRDWLGD